METADSCENIGPLDVSIKKENAQEDGTVAVKPKMDIEKFCGQFSNSGQIVEALKARIRELELLSKTSGDKFTCLLCKVSACRLLVIISSLDSRYIQTYSGHRFRHYVVKNRDLTTLGNEKYSKNV